MAAMAQLATRVLKSTSSKRCTVCSAEHSSEATFCRDCGAIVGGVACTKCGVLSPRDARHCDSCGHSLPSAASVARESLCESVAPSLLARIRTEGLSPTALVGFGAVLALAAASSPWYLFGAEAGTGQQATLTQLLAAGWQAFPGIPLALIAVAAVAAAIASLFHSMGTSHAGVAVISGLVMLLSAAWL